MSEFDRFIQLGREWTDRATFWRHLEGRPIAWLQALEWQLLADATGHAGAAGWGTVETPRLGPSERRLIEAKRARIRAFLQSGAGRRRAA
jgi:hypothetical protein